MLQSHRMKFDGQLLTRGFWLYVWQIKSPDSVYVYVGRTGDSSSANASSPFKRIGQHLDSSPNANGCALGKQLQRIGIDHCTCEYEMIAIGPIYPEQADFDAHKPLRDAMAALERAVADELRSRGYRVLGTHPKQRAVDSAVRVEVFRLLDTCFPPLQSEESTHVACNS